MHIGFALYGSLQMQSGGFLYDRQILHQLRAGGDQVSVIELPWRSYLRSLLDNFDEALCVKLASGAWDVLIEDELAHPSLVRTNRRIHELTRKHLPIITLVHLLHSTSQEWPSWQAKLYRSVERQYLRSVDGCIYVSRANQKQAEALMDATAPAVIAYPAGDHLQPKITPEQIKERCRRPGPLQIIYLGSVIRRKSLHTLLTALAQLKEVDWQLRVIGDLNTEPEYAQMAQHMASSPAFASRVSFLGVLDQVSVAQELTQGSVMVLPSLSEGYAIAYLEALGHGLAVIATKASGAVELIEPGKNGFLIQPGDSESIAAQLKKLGQDKKLLEQMSLEARATFDQHPTWRDTALKIREFLAERIAANRKSQEFKPLFEK